MALQERHETWACAANNIQSSRAPSARESPRADATHRNNPRCKAGHAEWSRATAPAEILLRGPPEQDLTRRRTTGPNSRSTPDRMVRPETGRGSLAFCIETPPVFQPLHALGDDPGPAATASARRRSRQCRFDRAQEGIEFVRWIGVHPLRLTALAVSKSAGCA